MLGFINPEDVLKEVNLQENMQAAEFGCGAGKFSFALAKKLKEGRVYALDIQKEPLSVLSTKAKQEGIYNIEPLCCDLEREKGSTLPDNYLDLVLIPNLLFQADDKNAIILEAKRLLKDKGRILIVDWKEESSFGPEKDKRVSVKDVKKIIENTGLKIEKEFSAGAFHWGLVLSRILSGN